MQNQHTRKGISLIKLEDSQPIIQSNPLFSVRGQETQIAFLGLLLTTEHELSTLCLPLDLTGSHLSTFSSAFFTACSSH